MFIKMLKNDIKRNKATSILLCLFILTASMLVAGAFNIVVEITGAMDDFYEQAKPLHYMQMVTGIVDQEAIDRFSAANSLVLAQQTQELLGIDNNIIYYGDNPEPYADSVMENSFVTRNQKFDILLDLNNHPVSVEQGQIAAPLYAIDAYGLEIGDSIIVNDGRFEMSFIVVEFLRDSQMNASLVSSKRFLIHETDYERLKSNTGEVEYLIEFLLADLSKTSEFAALYLAAGLPSGVEITYPAIQLMNAMTGGLSAVILVFAGIALISISVMCLRFTIIATLEDDCREIGVMKAIGLAPQYIGKLYKVKYFTLSGAACVIGYLLSLLFASAFTRSVSLYMGKAPATVWTFLFPLFGAIAVFAIIAGMCSLVLRKLRGVSAVEAIRGGGAVMSGGGGGSSVGSSTGSSSAAVAGMAVAGAAGADGGAAGGVGRAGAASTVGASAARAGSAARGGAANAAGVGLVFSRLAARFTGIHMCKLRNINAALGVLDVMKRFRAYKTPILVYMLCAFLIIVPINFLNTINSTKISGYMGVGRCDAIITLRYSEDAGERYAILLETLGADAEVSQYAERVTASYKTQNPDGVYVNIHIQSGDFTLFPIPYIQGGAPSSGGEIALSLLNAREFEMNVGDSMEVLLTDGEPARLTVSGIYQDLTNGGKTAQAHLPWAQENTLWYSVALDFADTTDAVSKINHFSNLFAPAKVIGIDAYISQTFAATIRQLESVTLAVCAISIFIAALITTLFLNMIFAKDRRQIIIMKGLGFASANIRAQYIAAAVLSLLIGLVLGVAAANTLGEGLVGALMGGVGASRISFVINPLIAYGVCPAILLTAVVAAVLLSARTISRYANYIVGE